MTLERAGGTRGECTICPRFPIGVDKYEPWVVACVHYGDYTIRVWESNLDLGPPFFGTEGPFTAEHQDWCDIDCLACRYTDFLAMGEAVAELRSREPEMIHIALTTTPL